MGFQDFMNKVRQWDNKSAQWMMKHFYLLFFELALVVIFIFFFANSLRVIDIAIDMEGNHIIERLLFTQSISTLLIVILLLFNSFWMLYLFNGVNRIRNLLRNIDYHLSRKRQKDN